MKVGDIIEMHKGAKAMILSVEKIYPRHTESPARGFEVHWIDEPPIWSRPGLIVPACSVRRVVARTDTESVV